MPLYRADHKLLYYVHVPKCAGTSVTEYLSRRFGPPAFEDRAHRRSAARHPWSATSPQHIDAASLSRILPREFYDASVAIVRHPERRLASAYRFQRSEGTVPKGVGFGMWLRGIEALGARRPFLHDNHVRPMCDFLPPETTWFRMEDGFGPFMRHLDDLFGPPDTDIDIGHEKRDARVLTISDSARARIRRLYASDYEMFGYADDPES